MPERLCFVASNFVATIVIINGPVLQISQKVQILGKIDISRCLKTNHSEY